MYKSNASSKLDIIPRVYVLVVVSRGVGELHDKLDDAEGLEVQAVGGHLVSHSLGAAAADTEHHDCLEQVYYQICSLYIK